MQLNSSLWISSSALTVFVCAGTLQSGVTDTRVVNRTRLDGNTFSGCLGYPCYSALRHNMCCFGGTGSARLNQSLFPRFVFFSLSFLFFTLFLI